MLAKQSKPQNPIYIYNYKIEVSDLKYHATDWSGWLDTILHYPVDESLFPALPLFFCRVISGRREQKNRDFVVDKKKLQGIILINIYEKSIIILLE